MIGSYTDCFRKKWGVLDPDTVPNPNPYSSYRHMYILVWVVTFQLQPACFMPLIMTAHQGRRMISSNQNGRLLEQVDSKKVLFILKIMKLAEFFRRNSKPPYVVERKKTKLLRDWEFRALIQLASRLQKRTLKKDRDKLEFRTKLQMASRLSKQTGAAFKTNRRLFSFESAIGLPSFLSNPFGPFCLFSPRRWTLPPYGETPPRKVSRRRQHF